ncbi:MAG: hemolysin family protein [Parolsenella sp.]|uniref:hemolysin family protein n=1 Tax=unclassified Parolsenella TaxID=2623992 RepID=UPI002A76094B|nr:hemolysin family protein [Parolsenella sp.]MCI5949365.1 hemolysin family protein [Coriobacteriaceae bacterium]MDY3291922.1 hemolysin family protein [Parolsenella sp.]
MGVALSIILTLLLTLANGYFSMSEAALVAAKRAVLEHDADEGDRKAKVALELSGDSSQFLAAIQVAITLVGFFSAMVASTTLSDPLASWLISLGAPAAPTKAIAPIVITVIVSYVSVVMGELVPKRIALANAEEVSKSVAPFLRTFSKVVAPLVWLTAKSSDGLSKILGIKSADDRQDVSEEEIRYMVTDADDLSDKEKSMIHEIFDLGDTIAREVMVPRVDLTAVEDTETLSDVLRLMRRTGYSRIPVYHEDVDRIVGIAHIKDLLAPIVDKDEADRAVGAYVRAPIFVPDTKDIIPLLSEMQSSHDQMAIVVDEYGGTAGVITIEDIVEEVVGEIEDEFDPDNKYLTRLSEREWLVDGRFSIDDARDLGWPIPDSDEFETVAGFVLDLADSVPSPGEVFTVDGYTFRVQSLRGRRIALLRVTAPDAPAEDDEVDAEED